MKLYKLTNQDGTTFGGCQWGEDVTHTTDGKGDLCGPGWLHAYTDPLLAVFLNPVHGCFVNPLLWEAEGEIGKNDDGTKVGCTALTTIRQIPLPVVTNEQRVRFGILCAMQVYAELSFVVWAKKWLSGDDRAAWAAVAWVARAAVAWGAGAGAAWAAAWAAAEASGVAWGAEAARAAARVVDKRIDLPALARQATGDGCH